MKVREAIGEINFIENKIKARENLKRPGSARKRPKSAPPGTRPPKKNTTKRPGSAPLGGQDFNLVKSKFPRARSLSPIRRR